MTVRRRPPAHRLRRAAAGALLLALAAGAGCRDAAELVFTPPRATLRGISLGALGTNGPSLDVAVALENPNPYALTATGARYRLMLADSTEVGSGALSERVTVGAGDTATVRLPVTLGWSALGGAGRDLLRGTDVEVMVLGEVTVETPIGERAVPLRARSRVRGVR